MNPQVKKCVNYCRVSSREQEESGYSLPAQEKLLKDYSLQKGFKIQKVFAVSESASSQKQRQVFGEMLEILKKEKVQIIVCEKVDRLTRSIRDAVIVNEWINADPQREVHFAKENWVLTKDSKSNEKFIWNIRVSVSQYYTDNLSEEVKKGQREKASQGHLPTKPPYGYCTIGEKGHKIHVIDEKIAPLIKKAFDLYATGDYSLQKALNAMTELGLRTRSGNKMAKSRFAAMLSNPFYRGKIKWSGTFYEAKHELFITKETFDAVQDVMIRKDTPKYSKHFYLFKGIIKCSSCGGAVTWQKHKGWVYGYCNGYHGCPKKSAVREDLIDQKVVDLLFNIKLKNSRIFDWAEKVIKNSQKQKEDVSQASIEVLQQRLKQIESRFEKLYDDKIDSKITEIFYNAKVKQYTDEKEELLEAISKSSSSDTRTKKLNGNLFALSQKAAEIYRSSSGIDKKRLILKFVYKDIKLEDDREISTEYTEAFKLLVDIINDTNGSNLRFFDEREKKKFEPSDFVSTKTKSDPQRVVFDILLRR